MTFKEWIEIGLLITTSFIVVKSFFDKKRGSNDSLCIEIEKTNCNHNTLKERVIVIETQFKNHVKELKELKQLATDNHKELSNRLDHIYGHINSNNDLIKEALKRIK